MTTLNKHRVKPDDAIEVIIEGEGPATLKRPSASYRDRYFQYQRERKEPTSSRHGK